MPEHLSRPASEDVLVVTEAQLAELVRSTEYQELLAYVAQNENAFFTIRPMSDGAATAARAEQFAISVQSEIRRSAPLSDRVQLVAPVHWSACESPECTRQTVAAEVQVHTTIAEGPLLLEYVWNAWAESEDPEEDSTGPVEVLDLRSQYRVSIDLANGRYPEPGVKHHEVAREFAERIEREATQTRSSSMRFTPVLMLDSMYFETQSVVLPAVEVDLREVRQAIRSDNSNGFVEILTFAQLQPFSVVTGDRAGLSAIGLSIWQENRPVDEVWFPFCIGDEEKCDEGLTTRSGLGGSIIFDSIDGNPLAESVPDAALHIVELSKQQVMGVFWRNLGQSESHNYRVWTISRDADRFIEMLDMHQKRFSEAQSFAANVGEILTNGLFPTTTEGQKALDDFVAFIELARSDGADSAPFKLRNRPTIFVRYLRSKFEPLLYPLGLLNPSGDDDGFVGFHARIETPLPIQRYRSSDHCIAQWTPTLPLPTGDSALDDAHAEFSARLRPQSPWDSSTALRISTGLGAVPAFTDFQSLHSWIIDRVESEATMLAVVSHHDNSALYFRSEDAYVSAQSVARRFNGPSAALLAGCSTGAPGAAELIGALNRQGVDSVITTNTGISGRLAGDFLECMLQQFETSGATTSIGSAFDGAQACLYDIKTSRGDQSRYGAQVLSLTFAGNPNLEICNSRTLP